MPAYNEEAAIVDAVKDIQDHVLVFVPESEMIVVDDGSRDRMGEILDELACHDARLKVIHRQNGGHGAALRTGLDAARGKYLFLIDSDRQIPLDGFVEHWHSVQGHDALFGVRRRRHDPSARLLLTRVVRQTLRLLFGVSLHDANAPYKIVKRMAWKRASVLVPLSTLAPSLFLAIILRQRGSGIVEREVIHRERETGTVTLRYWKLLKFCAKAFCQLVALRSSLKQFDQEAIHRSSTSV